MRHKLTEASEREFELGVERLVKREFEAARALPDDVCEA
jgi:hypothetical protein